MSKKTTEPKIYITSPCGSIFCLEAVGVTYYSNILKLVELCLTMVVANAKSETDFSYMKRIERKYRIQLEEKPLSSLMRIVIDVKPYAEHNSTKAAECFFKTKNWRKNYIERKQSGDQNTNKDSNSKISKKYQSAQKALFQIANN